MSNSGDWRLVSGDWKNRAVTLVSTKDTTSFFNFKRVFRFLVEIIFILNFGGYRGWKKVNS